MSSAFIRFILAEIPTATWNTSLNKELYRMWKMAQEKKGASLLLQHNALQVLSNRIATCTDITLNVTLISILEKICMRKKVSNALLRDNKATMVTLLKLIHTKEHCIFISLLYLLRSLLNHVNPGNAAAKMWLVYFDVVPDFMMQYCSILKRTSNDQEQICTLELLCIVLDGIAPSSSTEYSNDFLAIFYRVFIDKVLVMSICQAFANFLSKRITRDYGYFPDTQQVMATFLNIHCTLSSYKSVSLGCYEHCMVSFMCCVKQILTALNHFVIVLPVNALDVKMVRSLNVISEQLEDPTNEDYFIQMIQMWDLVKKREDTLPQTDDLNREFCQIILENLKRIVNRTNRKALEKILVKIHSSTVERFISSLEILDCKKCYRKVKTASYDFLHF